MLGCRKEADGRYKYLLWADLGKSAGIVTEGENAKDHRASNARNRYL
jgi:hypothetical protein